MFYLEAVMSTMSGGWWLFAMSVVVFSLGWGRSRRRKRRARNARFASLRRQSDNRAQTLTGERTEKSEPSGTVTTLRKQGIARRVRGNAGTSAGGSGAMQPTRPIGRRTCMLRPRDLTQLRH